MTEAESSSEPEPTAPAELDAEIAAAVEAVEVAEPEPSRWDRVRAFGWARGLLLALGVAAVVLGMVNAWRSEASTTLLVVGGLLALFALLIGSDWREIQLSHGESRARILRTVDQALEEVERRSPNDEIKREVAQIRAELDQAAEREKAAAEKRRRVARSLSSPSITSLLPSPKPRASHTFLGGTSVRLSLAVGARDTTEPYSCVIFPPTGSAWTKTIDGPLLGGSMPWTYSSVFPDEYPGTGPLEPGQYRVEWRRGRIADRLPGVSDASSALLAALVGYQTLALVARDAFAIEGATPAEPDTPGAADNG